MNFCSSDRGHVAGVTLDQLDQISKETVFCKTLQTPRLSNLHLGSPTYFSLSPGQHIQRFRLRWPSGKGHRDSLHHKEMVNVHRPLLVVLCDLLAAKAALTP